jgi:hypothetical protein
MPCKLLCLQGMAFNTIKNIAKKYLYPYLYQKKFGAEVQIAQANFIQNINQTIAQSNSLLLINCGFKVFSQFEEDGLILACIAALKIKQQTFIEIGSNNCVNSNCANLILNHGWHGLFIDGSEANLSIGKYFYNKKPSVWHPKPQFLQAFITAENINDLLSKQGFIGEVGVLSIDIDGNDYWVWNAITVIEPAIVVIETHVEFGLNNIVVPYNPNYVYPGKHPQYHGASAIAMQNLGNKKGYKLVGSNKLGFNQVYVKRSADLQNIIPEIAVEETLKHPATIASFIKFEPIKDWEYIKG